jgi:hypothetical protein
VDRQDDAEIRIHVITCSGYTGREAVTPSAVRDIPFAIIGQLRDSSASGVDPCSIVQLLHTLMVVRSDRFHRWELAF